MVDKPENPSARQHGGCTGSYRAARQARVDWYLSQRPTVSKTVRERVEVPGPERIVEVVREVPVRHVEIVSDPAHIARIAEMEAELAALRALAAVEQAASVPEALQKFRTEGETDAALRRRLKQMIFDLHSRREAARQGIGTFTDDDYNFLRLLDRQDWLGS